MTTPATKRKSGNTGKPPPPKRQRKRDVTKRKASDQEVNDKESTPKPKVKRPDKQMRTAENKSRDIVVVKASFRGRFAPLLVPDVRDILLELINEYIYAVSQMVVRGSLVANEVLLEYMRQGLQPDLSSTFFRHCMTGRSSDPIITSVLQHEFADHPIINEPVGTWVSLNYATNLYATVFDNNLWMSFESRFKGYVRDWMAVNNIGDDCLSPIMNIILGKPYYRPTVLQQQVWSFICEERVILENPQDFYAEKAPQALLLKYQFRMLEFKRVNGRPKGFSIAPIHKVRRHHIVIDSTVLYVMLQEVFNRLQEETPMWIQEVALTTKEQALHEYRDMMWANLFNWEGLSNHTFHQRVLTDGVQASFVFDCPKRTSCEIPLSEVIEEAKATGSLDDLPIISIDPGRTNLITAHDLRSNKFFTLTRRSYYASIRKSLEMIRWWENEIQDINMELSMYSLRTSDENLCRGYRRIYFKQYNRLWASRFHVRRAKETFHIYSTKRSVLDRFLLSLTTPGQPKPIIVYGAASMRSHGPGEMSVPVKKIFEACKRIYRTFKVNEHLTTKCHSACWSRMHPVKNRLEKRPVRGLMYCRTCKQLVNRDRDACRSIEDVGLSLDRPQYLSFTRPFEYKAAVVILPGKRHKKGVDVNTIAA